MREIFAASRPSLKLGTASKSGEVTARRLAPPEGAVEMDGGAYEAEVGKGLREVAQGLAGGTNLLGVEPEVVGVGEHLLQGETRLIETAGLGQAFDEPEGAHVEAALWLFEAV